MKLKTKSQKKMQKNAQKKIFNTLIYYNENFFKKEFRLYTNNDEVFSIKFPIIVFLDYIRKNKVFENKELYNINEIIKILDQEINKETPKSRLKIVNKKERRRIHTSCDKILGTNPITLNTTHSVIENGREAYIVQLTDDKELNVFKLLGEKDNENSSYKKYIIIDIINTSLLKQLINDSNSYVSFPVKSKYIDKSTEKEKVTGCKLTKEEAKKREIDFKELHYIDQNQNIRTEEVKISIHEYLKRTPMIRK